MGQQHDFYLVQSGNLVPGAALWRGFLVCFQQPSLLRSANLDSSDLEGSRLGGAILENAILECADLRGAVGLTESQVKDANDWGKAFYDNGLREELKLDDDHNASLEGECEDLDSGDVTN